MIDKPVGPTSHDCVAKVRRAYGLRRVGHGGTLDPAVTGVLPIAVGSATRLLPYLSGDKHYQGVVRLGLSTSTDDLQGEVISSVTVPLLARCDLEKAIEPFRGRIQQRPPRISAVHVRGERAYTRARRGEDLQLPAREVTIHSLGLGDWDPIRAELHLEIRCSAGTYIRSLARDLGEALGCGGALARLRRVGALGFSLDGAVTLERLEAPPPPALISPLLPLAHLSRQLLEEEEHPGWRCGRSFNDRGNRPAQQPVAVLRVDGSLAGIALADGLGRLHPRLVLDAAC